MSTSTLVCLGLGYSARHYAAAFGARFSRIVGTSRSSESAAALAARDLGGRRAEMLVFGGTTAEPAVAAALADADALLVSASPDEGRDPVLATLGDALMAASRLRCIVLLSTVGVYGDHAGGWVDETTPPDPARPQARARIAAEDAWRALGQKRGIPVAILRLSGIYGPGRNPLVNLRRGQARNVAKPGQVFNRIHVADIAQAIEAAFAQRADGVFNVTDDEPTPPGDPIVFAASLLGVPPPPAIPFGEAVKTMPPMAASFYAENRRVRNDRLKRTLGVRLRYPTYREGLRALHAAGEPGLDF
ncbi:MAG TPA: SDR family oxidoreductase [Xanthobacteraceae bacterium]|nr:SDR family oxidoreductase [Xanthobacteraceae bacterium]